MLFDLNDEAYSKAWDLIDENTTPEEVDKLDKQLLQNETIKDGGSQDKDETNTEPSQDFFDDENQLKGEEYEEKVQEKKQEPEQEDKQEKQLVDSIEVVLNGQKIIVTADEVQDLLQKGLQARLELKELQEIKPIFNFLIENGIDKKDLIALKDLKSGNKEALQYFKDLAGIKDNDDGWFNDDEDEFIFDEEPQPKQKQKRYEPKLEEENTSKDPMETYIEYVYSQDPDLANRALTILNELPNSIKLELYNEQLFPAFVQSVKTGEWDKVSPLALKIYAKDNKINFKFAYQKAIQMLQNGNLQEKEPQPPQQIQQQNQSSNNRNLENATIPYTDDSSDGGSQLSYDDYWNMPLEELEKLTN